MGCDGGGTHTSQNASSPHSPRHGTFYLILINQPVRKIKHYPNFTASFMGFSNPYPS